MPELEHSFSSFPPRSKTLTAPHDRARVRVHKSRFQRGLIVVFQQLGYSAVRGTTLANSRLTSIGSTCEPNKLLTITNNT